MFKNAFKETDHIPRQNVRIKFISLKVALRNITLTNIVKRKTSTSIVKKLCLCNISFENVFKEVKCNNFT